MNEPSLEKREESLETLVNAIADQFKVVMGSPERVKAACDELKEQIGLRPDPQDFEQLDPLLSLMGNQKAAIVSPLFDFLDELSLTTDQPWPLLTGMISARDTALARRGLQRALKLAKSGALCVTRETAKFFSQRMDVEPSPLMDPECLSIIAEILFQLDLPKSSTHWGAILALYLEESEASLRMLAARILDLKSGGVAGPDIEEKVLGSEDSQFFSPYLRATQASHVDLLHLAPAPGTRPPVLSQLQKARDSFGPELVEKVITELGWDSINLGLDFYDFVNIRVKDSFPIMVRPLEEPLIMSIRGARYAHRSRLFIALGGLRDRSPGLCSADDSVARFRSLNMTHSEALSYFLDVAPPTPESIMETLALMDKIVDDYAILFASFNEECAILPGVYKELRHKIIDRLAKEKNETRLSIELTRLIQMFEEPESLGGVGTLHGLKRYLHQKGLHYGLKLVKTIHSTDRVVGLLGVLPDGDIRLSKCIQYIDFSDKYESGGGRRMPNPVRIVAESFGWQLLHGREVFPSVKIFCYGNEVHYYVSFRGHPAFLRIDYSPPSRGGMIDLEYFGVSKNDLNYHPNPSLDALQRIFIEMDFDIQVQDTRVHARYDKEKALNFDDLLEKARSLFHLIPYLMEIDWAIGDLDLPEKARLKVTEAWIGFFTAWGVLPIHKILTSDRLGISVSTDSTEDQAWSGRGPYRDRFTCLPPREIFASLRSQLDRVGLEIATPLELYSLRSMGQTDLEKYFLHPLRKRVSAGGILETPEGLRKNSEALFRRDHEASRFALILSGNDDGLRSSALVARLVAKLEQTLRFQTTGSVNGHEVQRARLALFEEDLYLYTLRGDTGEIVLSMFSRGEKLYEKRESPFLPWRTNISVDPFEFVELLDRANYLTPNEKKIPCAKDVDTATIRERLRKVKPPPPRGALKEERIIEGTKVSPGRVLGPVLFGAQGRRPEDFDGAVMVSPSVHPDDNTYLYHTSGIVTTGGSILSHAGLLAMQFRKPSMIVYGKWRKSSKGEPILLYYPLNFSEVTERINGYQVSMRHKIHYREHCLREGDLVVLDANNGFLRVLGQGRDALVLHENLRHFGKVCRRLFKTSDDRKFLEIRGERLKTLYHIEKHLSKLTDPVLACHVIYELLLGEHLSGIAKNVNENARLLSRILDNPKVGDTCREYLLATARELADRYRKLTGAIRQQAPSSDDPVEILTWRLREIRLGQALKEILESMRASDVGFNGADDAGAGSAATDEIVRSRLEFLRAELVRDIESLDTSRETHASLRHLARRLERLNSVVGGSGKELKIANRINDRIDKEDRSARKRRQGRRVLWPSDAGFEFFPDIGWKAANLAEVERIGGQGLTPPWFVITDAAFREVMDQPLGGRFCISGEFSPDISLREAIQRVLDNGELDNHEKSEQIWKLWDGVALPSGLTQSIIEAYRELIESACGDGDANQTYVAIRSSAREEDTESAVRAGEFETFLYITGEGSLLKYLKLAWSGMWTERAIHNRGIIGEDVEETGGGLIVQKNIFPRVAGVLQTVNIAEYEMREMVVNAGLGVGEGIVSGAVTADQFVVAKQKNMDDVQLRFRPLINDKCEQVVFNTREGVGTVRCKVPYHQRLRPALEYAELCELVRVASRLENVYGYPLDMEFCVEGSRVWILQARPVPTFQSVLQRTLEDYPLYKK